MSLISKQTALGSNPISEGTHIATCVGLIDLGTQHSERFDKWAEKVLITWEVEGETYTDNDDIEHNKVISKEYSNSLSEKSNLRKVLEGWRGQQFTEEELQGFNLSVLLGVSCMLGVVHKQGTRGIYADINSILKLPKAIREATPIKSSKDFMIFDISAQDWEIKMENLPDWIQNKIKLSKEYQEKFGITAPASTDIDDFVEVPNDDDLPF